jgi:cytoplasmic tRNA 2-thiolation protein 1
LFKKGDVIAIAASGGKDSTVLAQVLKTLNERYNYGLKLVLLSIDEGITGNIISCEHFFVIISLY